MLSSIFEYILARHRCRWLRSTGTRVVKLLLGNIANVDPKDSYGRTPLSLAVLNCHEAVVKLLLLGKAVDVDPKDSYGRTTLSLAALNGHEVVVKLLLLGK